MRNYLKILTITSLVFLTGCKKDDEAPTPDDDTLTELDISVESTSVNTFEIINVERISGSDLEDTYSGKFGDIDIQLNKVSGSTLVFVIPDVESGQYQLKTDLGNIDFDVTKTVIANSEELITDVFTTFDDEVSNIESSDELDDTKSFKTEVTELYNSLTEEEKKEVAMYYEANKEVFKAFKEDLANIYDAPTTFGRTFVQSDCPKTDFKSFYSCTGDNLGNSIQELGVSIKKIAEPIAYAAALGKLASATWYLGPSVWGLTAVGASLSIGTAVYILITEVRPAFITFKSSLSPFLKANWIFTKATFAVITGDYENNVDTDFNIDAKFRTIEESDTDVSAETGFFISAYGSLTSAWNDFAKVLGSIPSFSQSEEAIELETSDITISNISNSNVELISQNGEKVKFKSLSGDEEDFSFEITVNKEGFTQSTTVNATLTAEEEDSFIGVWESSFITVSFPTFRGDVNTIDNCPNSSFSEFEVLSEKYKVTFSNDGQLCFNLKDKANELDRSITSQNCTETFGSTIIESDYSSSSACYTWSYNEETKKLVIIPSNQTGTDLLDGSASTSLFLTVSSDTEIIMNNPNTSDLDLWDGEVSFIKQ